MDYTYNPSTRLDTRDYGLATFVLKRPMRHSKAEKANTRKRIVTIAAKKFREEGLAGIGIADMMKEAGLTVGGFYKHFKSRTRHLPKRAVPR
jgi:hypothetical protein